MSVSLHVCVSVCLCVCERVWLCSLTKEQHCHLGSLMPLQFPMWWILCIFALAFQYVLGTLHRIVFLLTSSPQQTAAGVLQRWKWDCRVWQIRMYTAQPMHTLACPWERLVKPRNRVENLGTGNRGHSAKPSFHRSSEIPASSSMARSTSRPPIDRVSLNEWSGWWPGLSSWVLMDLAMGHWRCQEPWTGHSWCLECLLEPLSPGHIRRNSSRPAIGCHAKWPEICRTGTEKCGEPSFAGQVQGDPRWRQ